MERSGNRRFQIRHLLGRGGFGEVYRAVMTTPGGLEADVAVKLLRTEGDGDHVRRLRDEGRLLSALQHPSILRVWDLASLDGRVGLVTEYVPGQDLGDCFREPDPITTRALLEVVAQVAEGLKAAWSGLRPGATTPMRIVHRDIKPSNLRLGPHGQVKILDFGIAHTEHTEREARTGANATLGSLAYMAPERFGRRAPGPECDVYSLGCVLFEGLAGRRLHPEAIPLDMVALAGSAEAWARHVDSALAELPDDLPDGLQPLLLGMLAHDPDARPTAGQVAERCDALADAAPGQPLKRWARDRTWPPAEPEAGALDGKVLTDGTLDTGATQAVGDWSSDTFRFDGPLDPEDGWTGPTESTEEPASAVAPSGRRWLLPALGLLALVCVVALGLALPSGPPPTPPTQAPAPVATAATAAPAPAPAAPEPVLPAPEPAPSEAAPPKPAPAPAPTAPAPVAPAPVAPAPVAPAPVAAPEPVPEPQAAPAPVATGQVVVSGATLVKVEVDGQPVPADAVPARTEAFLVIDFGADTHRIGPHLVSEGMTLSVRCVRMTQDCTVE